MIFYFFYNIESANIQEQYDAKAKIFSAIDCMFWLVHSEWNVLLLYFYTIFIPFRSV